ncbi:hypothetical protein BKN38_08440 [Helicobacter sp. CLO-3]|uniref:hypothetical protein n=1 Tax=unclassified Helicobacter TaxID=2593540 RepID=UPI00080592F0|nr:MULTISPECIES: hypothetical protein [unclassified Helicobacter]OBV29023.1 hypothetical protein BA723_07310 [Helicobacter sp. CLO-3]OHU81715.1 hypothetical protein BKN38_08440 [Helicobacter sp. CLO-3]
MTGAKMIDIKRFDREGSLAKVSTRGLTKSLIGGLIKGLAKTLINRAFFGACAVLLASFALTFSGCFDSKKEESRAYTFNAASGGANAASGANSATSKTYSIETKEKGLIIKANNKELDSAVFLAFLAKDCDACDAYYEHLNHLANSDDVVILGILDAPLSQQELQVFKAQKNIAFDVLSPVLKASADSSAPFPQNPLLSHLAQEKSARESINANNIFATDSVASADSSENASAESSENANIDSGVDSGINSSATNATDSIAPNASATDTTNAPTTPTAARSIRALPYFVLYDKHHRFYQDYEGIVPEEIFSSDIAQIAH